MAPCRRYCNQTHNYEEEEDDDTHDKEIARRLTAQSYHLPNYSYWEDYLRHLFNNHPVLGI